MLGLHLGGERHRRNWINWKLREPSHFNYSFFFFFAYGKEWERLQTTAVIWQTHFTCLFSERRICEYRFLFSTKSSFLRLYLRINQDFFPLHSYEVSSQCLCKIGILPEIFFFFFCHPIFPLDLKLFFWVGRESLSLLCLLLYFSFNQENGHKIHLDPYAHRTLHSRANSTALILTQCHLSVSCLCVMIC